LALLDAAVEGEIHRLVAGDIDELELRNERDPASARGLLFVNRFPCDRATMETLLTHNNQNAIYEAYEDYERTFRGDREAWRAGGIDVLDWTGTIEAKIPLVGTYVYDFITEVRRLPIPDTHPSAGEVALLIRSYMVAPAVWDREGPAMDQDYQVEVFLPFEGDIIHIYGFWRDMDLGTLGTMDSEGVARITFDQLIKWDRTTAQTCLDGVPAEEPPAEDP
jgi:hypothetical protein